MTQVHLSRPIATWWGSAANWVTSTWGKTLLIFCAIFFSRTACLCTWVTCFSFDVFFHVLISLTGDLGFNGFLKRNPVLFENLFNSVACWLIIECPSVRFQSRSSFNNKHSLWCISFHVFLYQKIRTEAAECSTSSCTCWPHYALNIFDLTCQFSLFLRGCSERGCCCYWFDLFFPCVRPIYSKPHKFTSYWNW